MEEIRKIIRRLLFEAIPTRHSFKRFYQRIEETNIASPEELDKIKRNLDIMEMTNFPRNYSFAILAGWLGPKPDSPYTLQGTHYFRLIDPDTGKDSTGNQLWVVIRENTLTTKYLRKEYQTKDDLKNVQNQRVDFSIRNLKDYIDKNGLFDFNLYKEKNYPNVVSVDLKKSEQNDSFRNI